MRYKKTWDNIFFQKDISKNFVKNALRFTKDMVYIKTCYKYIKDCRYRCISHTSQSKFEMDYEKIDLQPLSALPVSVKQHRSKRVKPF